MSRLIWLKIVFQVVDSLTTIENRCEHCLPLCLPPIASSRSIKVTKINGYIWWIVKCRIIRIPATFWFEVLTISINLMLENLSKNLKFWWWKFLPWKNKKRRWCLLTKIIVGMELLVLMYMCFSYFDWWRYKINLTIWYVLRIQHEEDIKELKLKVIRVVLI